MPSTKKSQISQNETRKMARIMFSTIKKIGSFKGGSLKRIYEYIKAEYPSSKSNIMELKRTLQKALAFDDANKKTGNMFVGAPAGRPLKPGKHEGIIEAKRTSRKKRRRRRRSRQRSKRRGKSPRRRSSNRT